MTCNRCGTRTHKRLCADCERDERYGQEIETQSEPLVGSEDDWEPLKWFECPECDEQFRTPYPARCPECKADRTHVRCLGLCESEQTEVAQ